MSSGEQLRLILNRLSTHIFPEEDPRYWQALAQETKQEKKIIKTVRDFSRQKYEGLTEEIKENDWQLLGYLIERFADTFSKEPFDQQILALIRAIEAYKNPQKKGEIFQMATGEGKSSVVIPLLAAFLYLKGERLEVYEINPYLLENAYNHFLEFAKALGIEEKVGILEEYQDKKHVRKKPIVFGYWADFIHHRQHQFLTEEKNGQKPPIMILDEVDPLLNEEAIVPAVIGEEKEESTISIISSLIEQINNPPKSEEVGEEEKRREKEIKEKLTSFNFRGKEIDLFDVTQEKPEKEEDFFQRIKTIFEHLSRLMEEDPDLKQMSDQQKKGEIFKNYMWHHLIALFEEKTGVKYEELSKEEQKALKEIFPGWRSFFWFSYFEGVLVNAFLMKEGVDYKVEEISVIERMDQFPFIFLTSKIKIVPLSVQTGYSERGKQFDFLTHLFLLIKHAKSLKQLPETISIGKKDRMSILAYYVNAIEQGSKILGFTGTATAVAKRIREVYGLETTVIPTHFETNRKENPMEFFESSERKVERVVEILNTETSRNTLIVVENPKEAEELKEAIEKFFEESVAINSLSAENEEDDYKLYQWLSQKEEKRKILICVKMIGRGVDLRPDKAIIDEGGFLLISLTPFKYRRSFDQLLGRVGRRQEAGEVYTLVSFDDEIFSYLSREKKEKLTGFIKQKRFDQVKRMVDEAWNYWEDEITQRMRYWIIFSTPIERIRLWIEGKINLLFYEEKELLTYGINPEEFKRYLHTWWTDILEELEDTYQAWLAAYSLTSFGQTSDQKSFWTTYVFSYLRDRFTEEFF
jgi:preprotein translocase subunit SecA